MWVFNKFLVKSRMPEFFLGWPHCQHGSHVLTLTSMYNCIKLILCNYYIIIYSITYCNLGKLSVSVNSPEDADCFLWYLPAAPPLLGLSVIKNTNIIRENLHTRPMKQVILLTRHTIVQMLARYRDDCMKAFTYWSLKDITKHSIYPKTQ